ncbi:MAG: sigma-54-dependent transcriptional regulator [Oligoflexales bacterium]
MQKQQYLGRLLIVDDDHATQEFWKFALSQEGFRVDAVSTLSEMKEVVKRYSIDVILLDLQLDNENGLDGLPFLIAESPFSKIFVLTAHASVETAVSAMSKGATGYITKGTDPRTIAQKIRDNLEEKALEDSVFTATDFENAGLIGQSKSFKDLCTQISQLRDVDSTILITGESGTGKEVVARTLHNLSQRATKRFEAINCAAIPENLLESELFGHKKGSFTDAKTDRKGIFELCSGGTLLLDEIGDMPISLQTKLLRVIQERVVTPVGCTQPIKIDTRVIAATHRDLPEEIQNGAFREDLYYRLSVVPLHIAPLRQRKEDIPLLVDAFVKEFSSRFNRPIQIPSPEIMKRLLSYDWRGNVRELRNAIERAVVLSRDGSLRLEDIFQHIHQTGFTGGQNSSSDLGVTAISEEIYEQPLTDAKQAFEKNYISRLLKKTKGNITEASKICGRYRADVYKLLEKYELELDSFRN